MQTITSIFLTATLAIINKNVEFPIAIGKFVVLVLMAGCCISLAQDIKNLTKKN